VYYAFGPRQTLPGPEKLELGHILLANIGVRALVMDFRLKNQWIERRNSGAGFSLIELLIVMVIIALLATIGYPSYTEQVRKTARKEAVGKILETASRLEQFRTQKMAYPSASEVDAFGYDGNKYTISVETVTEGVAVKATPVADTLQADDKCGEMTYTTPGIWSFTGTDMTEKECI